MKFTHKRSRQGTRQKRSLRFLPVRVSAILKDTTEANVLETSYFSLCIHTRRNAAAGATNIRRSRTGECRELRANATLDECCCFSTTRYYRSGEKERERDVLYSYRRVHGYYVLLRVYTILPRGLPREYKHSEFII